MSHPENTVSYICQEAVCLSYALCRTAMLPQVHNVLSLVMWHLYSDFIYA